MPDAPPQHADPSVPVRRVGAGDAAALRAVRLRALAEDPDAFETRLADAQAEPLAAWERWAAARDQATFVAELGDGFGGLVLVRPSGEDGRAELNAMWVAPELRGAGAALALVDAGLAWLRERGFSSVGLRVVAGADGPLALYRRAGFVVSGRDSRAVPPELLLERRL